MLRKALIALSAVAAIGISSSAMAAGHGGHGGGGFGRSVGGFSHMSAGGFHPSGGMHPTGMMRPGGPVHPMHSGVAWNGRTWNGTRWHHHHHHDRFFFGVGFAGPWYDDYYYGSCWQLVPTYYGWQRVWTCGYPYGWY